MSVYFLKSELCGSIKIGSSTTPDHRLDTLWSWCPWELTLIGLVEGGPIAERWAHLVLERHRKKGEWFHGNRAVNKQINKWLKDNKIEGAPPELKDLFKTPEMMVLDVAKLEKYFQMPKSKIRSVAGISRNTLDNMRVCRRSPGYSIATIAYAAAERGIDINFSKLFKVASTQPVRF